MQSSDGIPIIEDLEHFIKPNVRKIFLPDIGYTLFDVDLRQADAYTVAWESNDEVLKEMFRAGIDLHTQNAKDIFSLFREPNAHERQMAKHGVHGTNFGGSARTLAKKLDMTVHQATQFQARWFKLHPQIQKWHKRIEMQLMETRMIKNAFGYRRIFFDRVDGLLPEALAWVPQSTTVNVLDKGLLNIVTNIPEVQLLLQVHDSGLGQFRNFHYPTIRKRIQACMLIPVPYDDPMVIPVDISCSRVSWGNCKKVPFIDDEVLCPF